MRRLAVFTSTRAEYGLLRPLMAEVAARPDLQLQLLVSGTHLSQAHGQTWQEIVADGFHIDARIDMGIGIDSAQATATSAAAALLGTARELVRLQPDVLILLGDRYELLAAAQAALLCGVPIAHIHGGEVTEGAIDESIRHAVTKLAHWHFAAAETYARRIQQLGEANGRVWNVGALAMDNIATLDPVPKEELERLLGITLRKPSLLVTYHPVTLSSDHGLAAMRALLEALEAVAATVVVTGTNADPGATAIRQALRAFASARAGRVALVESLGARRYLSLMRCVDVVVGNSSSGLLEAPALRVPTVDIGQRQQGRLRAPSVLHCGESANEIRHALETALSPTHRSIAAQGGTPYGRPGAAKRIVDVLQTVDLRSRLKAFVDRHHAVDVAH